MTEPRTEAEETGGGAPSAESRCSSGAGGSATAQPSVACAPSGDGGSPLVGWRRDRGGRGVRRCGLALVDEDRADERQQEPQGDHHEPRDDGRLRAALRHARTLHH